MRSHRALSGSTAQKHESPSTGAGYAIRQTTIWMSFDRPTGMGARLCWMSLLNSAVTSISKPDTRTSCSMRMRRVLLSNKQSEPRCHERRCHAEYREARNALYLTPSHDVHC